MNPPDVVTVVAEALLAQLGHVLSEQQARDVAQAIVYDLHATGHLVTAR